MLRACRGRPAGGGAVTFAPRAPWQGPGAVGRHHAGGARADGEGRHRRVRLPFPRRILLHTRTRTSSSSAEGGNGGGGRTENRSPSNCLDENPNADIVVEIDGTDRIFVAIEKVRPATRDRIRVGGLVLRLLHHELKAPPLPRLRDLWYTQAVLSYHSLCDDLFSY